VRDLKNVGGTPGGLPWFLGGIGAIVRSLRPVGGGGRRRRDVDDDEAEDDVA